MLHTNRILILAPHTDDGELGCGASLAKYIAAGKVVMYVAFSTCQQSLSRDLPADTLVNECKAATAELGIRELQILDYPVRHFTEHRQAILEDLVRINKAWEPQTVFVPAEHDLHQDHQVIYAEGLRAFKNCNLLGYELPWNNVRFSPTYFEKVSENDLLLKQKSLQEYKSQAARSYMQPDFIKSLATVRGMQSRTMFAEAFELYRMCS
jgi:LmbE family N-acetylglucosaminyl deacetylase